MLIQRICTGRMGSGSPNSTATRITSPSPRFVGRVQVMNLVRLSKTPAALLDRGLDGGEVVVGEHHVGGLLGHLGAGLPMATPMSACRSAGASLTPSPVMATTSPRTWSASTRRSFCSGRNAGEDRGRGRGPDQLVVAQAGKLARRSAPPAGPSSPVRSPRPICRAMAAAVRA